MIASMQGSSNARPIVIGSNKPLLDCRERCCVYHPSATIQTCITIIACSVEKEW